MLYTAFDSNGTQRHDFVGPVLCRTLAAVRRHTQDGDTIQRWGNAGQPAGTWDVRDGKLIKRK